MGESGKPPGLPARSEKRRAGSVMVGGDNQVSLTGVFWLLVLVGLVWGFGRALWNFGRAPNEKRSDVAAVATRNASGGEWGEGVRLSMPGAKPDSTPSPAVGPQVSADGARVARRDGATAGGSGAGQDGGLGSGSILGWAAAGGLAGSLLLNGWGLRRWRLEMEGGWWAMQRWGWGTMAGAVTSWWKKKREKKTTGI